MDISDDNVYSTLGSITIGGWLIIYLFIHFISYRRFQDNIIEWEQLYLKQIEQEMFPLLDDDIEDEEEEEDELIVPQEISNHNHNNEEIIDKNKQRMNEQLTLDFISANIRDTVRTACQQSWIRQQSTNDIYQSELPTKRKDITDHYHRRALRHIYQAKRGMNIITVVQMEQYGKSKAYRLRLYGIQSSRYWRWFMQLLLFIHCILVFWRPLTKESLKNEGYKIIPLTIECICIIFECIDLILFYFISFKWQDTSKNPLMSPSQLSLFSIQFLPWYMVH